MVEKIDSGNGGEDKEERLHYSNQTGHKERGRFSKNQQALGTRFPEVYFRSAVELQNVTVPTEEKNWLIRRRMMRITRSGRR